MDAPEDKSMLGKWDWWYRGVTHMSSFRYGNTVTYQMAEDFLRGLNVEDWGCGTGGFKRLHAGGYIGIDGSKTPFADITADLREYTSQTDGIMMRHILEHNYDWEKVLDNAVSSFKKRFCLVLFTPFTDETKVIAQNKKFGVDVPDISFKKEDIESHFKGLKWHLFENLATRTGYRVEHVYLISKAKVAVISASLGTTNKGAEHAQQSIPVDFFHFNDENFPPRFKAMTPLLQTKIVKMFSRQLIPDYDYYLWVGEKRLESVSDVQKLMESCKGVSVFKNIPDVFMYKNNTQNKNMLSEWWQFTSRADGEDKPYFDKVLKEFNIEKSAVDK